MAGTGICCGCFNLRQGAVVSVALGMVVGLFIVFLFIYLAFDPISLTQNIVREKLLAGGPMAMFILNTSIPLIALGVLTNVNFTSGGGTKILALMIFVVGVLWIACGAMLARRFANGYSTFTLSGHYFREHAKDPTKKGNLTKGVAAAVFVDSAAAQVLINTLPFPLNYFYWMGMWPMVPFVIFGLIPGLLTFFGVGPLIKLAGVMDAGGDGTEYVSAEKIHWFYSLSPADRDRVREGSDLEGGDSSDDSSEDEGEQKKFAPKRLAQGVVVR